MKTKLKSARVRTHDGWVSFTRVDDDIDTISVSETNVLTIRKRNGDAVAMFNPLGWSHVEVEWMADADS